MAVVAVVVTLSLLAAFIFASASAVQQRAAANVGLHGRPLALIRQLIQHPRWLAGWGANVFGFFSQTAALRLGNVAVVQPLLTTQLLFAVPLATIGTTVRPTRRDWFGAVAVCGGLALFLRAHSGTALPADQPDRGRLLVTIPVALIAIGTVAAAVLRPRERLTGKSPFARQWRSAVLGICAGCCFAYTAAFIVLTSHDLLGPGVLATATDWPGYALAASTGIGILLEQQSFALGTLPPALASMTITNPVVSYTLGILAFHAAAPHAVSAWVELSCGGALVCLGVWLLAASPTATLVFHRQTDEAPVSAAASAADR